MLFDEEFLRLELAEAENKFKEELSKLRTGAPNVSALTETVKIEYYGAFVPLKQVASYSVDKLTVILKPFDAANLKKIEDAINSSDVGARASAKEGAVYAQFPSMTFELREQEVTKLNKLLEERGRVPVRAIRRAYIDEIDALDKVSEDEQKRSRERVQELIDKGIENLETIAKQKEIEILEI